jgi:hypothetical protein
MLACQALHDHDDARWSERRVWPLIQLVATCADGRAVPDTATLARIHQCEKWAQMEAEGLGQWKEKGLEAGDRKQGRAGSTHIQQFAQHLFDFFPMLYHIHFFDDVTDPRTQHVRRNLSKILSSIFLLRQHLKRHDCLLTLVPVTHHLPHISQYPHQPLRITRQLKDARCVTATLHGARETVRRAGEDLRVWWFLTGWWPDAGLASLSFLYSFRCISHMTSGSFSSFRRLLAIVLSPPGRAASAIP